MKASEIEKVEIVAYRKSQYNDYNSAFKNGGVYDLTETYGYSATIDSIYNCNQVSKMLDHYSPENDIRVIMIVDGVTLSECFLSEAQNVMHKELGIE